MSPFEALDAGAAGLWRDYRDDTSNLLTRNALVLHYDELAQRAGISRAVATDSLHAAVDVDDLQQDLRMVLMELVEAWDPYRGVPFYLYAASRLAKRAISCQRTLTGVKRSMVNDPRPAELDAMPDFDVADEQRPRHSIAAERELRRHVVRHLKNAGVGRRQIAAILLRYFRGLRTVDVGQRLGRCESWTSQVVSKVQPVIADALLEYTGGRRAAA